MRIPSKIFLYDNKAIEFSILDNDTGKFAKRIVNIKLFNSLDYRNKEKLREKIYEDLNKALDKESLFKEELTEDLYEWLKKRKKYNRNGVIRNAEELHTQSLG